MQDNLESNIMGRNNKGGGRGRGGGGGGRGGGGGGRGGGGGGGGRMAGLKNMMHLQEDRLRAGAYQQNLNMFQDARNAEAVDVYIDGTVSLLGDLRALTTLKVEDTAIVKGVNNESALADVSMIDLKLNV